MNAKEMLKQAVRQVCEEAGEPWEELDEGDFDGTHIVKTAEVFATLVLAEHAAELDALRTENARLSAELEAVGAGGVQPLRAQAGWVLVPVEPTLEMLEAMHTACLCFYEDDQRAAYHAMLAATPKAPKQAAPVPPQKPKLRVGQIWRTRGGHVVEIVSETENSPRPFVCAIRGRARCKFTVTKNGMCYESAQHPNDLIELIPDVQKGGEA